MREFSPLAVLLGIVISVLFGAAAAFIGLKVGMTVSASIPAAVISMGVLRGLLKRGTILENNMVQTIASSGEALAAGMIFTIPALYLFGFDVQFSQMVMWGAIGGLIGVLFMIPLRRVLIVKEHGKLPYPEGVACAEVLEAGERGGVSARPVFWGLGIGAVYQLFRGLGFWPNYARVQIPSLRTAFGLDASPALLGVGYILGLRIAGYMMAGAVLGWFVIIPAIAFFGAGSTAPIFPETDKIISVMSPDELYEKYLRYVGAGAVVLGGLLSLIKSVPTIGSSVWQAFAAVFGRRRKSIERTDRDLPIPLLVLLLAALAYAMYALPQVGIGHIGAIAVLVFGFFFVTVSSRLVGVVGASSSPTSGMTIATLMGTAIVFTYVLNLRGDEAKFAVIAVGALVCCAISTAGDTSQDLKTGFLVKATPWKQQVGEIIGVLAATAVIAWVIVAVKDTYGYQVTEATPRPVIAAQANIMKLLVEGVMDGTLPWVLVVAGMAAALVIELLGIPSLPMAVGLYLPLELTTPIMAGGLIRWALDRRRRQAEQEGGPGILAASGFVAGEGLVGVAMVGVSAFIGWYSGDKLFLNPVSGNEERLLPHHFMPWLSQILGFPHTYGLGGVGDWLHDKLGLLGRHTPQMLSDFGFSLLAVLPFMLLMWWLIRTASQDSPAVGRRIIGRPIPLSERDIAPTQDVTPKHEDDKDTIFYIEEIKPEHYTQ